MTINILRNTVASPSEAKFTYIIQADVNNEMSTKDACCQKRLRNLFFSPIEPLIQRLCTQYEHGEEKIIKASSYH